MVMRISCTDRVYVLLMSYKEVLGSANIFIIVFFKKLLFVEFLSIFGQEIKS